MNLLQSIVVYFIGPVIQLLIFLIFIEVILSWLVGFNIVNLRNPAMAQIYRAIQAVTQPILNPIRRILPPFGGLDFSPIVALLGLSWVHGYIVPTLYSMVG